MLWRLKIMAEGMIGLFLLSTLCLLCYVSYELFLIGKGVLDAMIIGYHGG